MRRLVDGALHEGLELDASLFEAFLVQLDHIEACVGYLIGKLEFTYCAAELLWVRVIDFELHEGPHIFGSSQRIDKIHRPVRLGQLNVVLVDVHLFRVAAHLAEVSEDQHHL